MRIRKNVAIFHQLVINELTLSQKRKANLFLRLHILRPWAEAQLGTVLYYNS